MNYVTTIEMSEIWGISARRIALLCEQERIEGAIKKGKTWLIPEDAEKPADKRKKCEERGCYICTTSAIEGIRVANISCLIG